MAFTTRDRALGALAAELRALVTEHAFADAAFIRFVKRVIEDLRAREMRRSAPPDPVLGDAFLVADATCVDGVWSFVDPAGSNRGFCQRDDGRYDECAPVDVAASRCI